MKHYKYFYIFYKFYIIDNKQIESKLFVDKLLHFSTRKMMLLTSKGGKKPSFSTTVVVFYKNTQNGFFANRRKPVCYCFVDVVVAVFGF